MSGLVDTLYTKPPPGTRVDYGNPLSIGMYACYLFNEAGGTEVFDHANMGFGNLSFTAPSSVPFGYTGPQWTQYGLEIDGNVKGYVSRAGVTPAVASPITGCHTLRVVHIPRTWPGGFTSLVDSFGSARNLSIFFDTSGNASYSAFGGSNTGFAANNLGQTVGGVYDFIWTKEFDKSSGGLTSIAYYLYVNGKLCTVERNNNAAAVWYTPYTFSVGGNVSGGGSNYDGQILQVQMWDRGLQASEVAQLAANPYAMMSDGPLHIFGRAPQADATATATFGTITLTAPIATAYQNADNTATATFGTITLTAPTAEGSQSAIATATFGTITLTAPTVSGISTSSTASASFATIYLQAPTAFPYGPPFSAAMQDRYYWGRGSRGQLLNVMWQPEFLPDDIATVDFWLEATSIVKTLTIPVLEEDDSVFGIALLLDEDFEDGNYVAVIRFSSGGVAQCSIAYLEIRGGTGSPAIISTLEIDRPLGRAVVTQDGDGEVMIGYEPRTGE